MSTVCYLPFCTAQDGSCKATFTLTNIVAQDKSLNPGQWRVYEKELLDLFKTQCSKVYVLVGAIPSQGSLINKRVNIPTHLWNAYCCLHKNNKTISGLGAIALNRENKVTKNIPLNKLIDTINQHNPEVGLKLLFRNHCKSSAAVVANNAFSTLQGWKGMFSLLSVGLCVCLFLSVSVYY